MEEILTCPVCHVTVRPTDFFCYNCGKNLQQAPPPISLNSQIGIYLGSVFLAPMGIIWGLRYLKQSDTPSKRIGVLAMALSVITILVVTRWLIGTYNAAMTQVNQIQNLQGF
jgi:hypothetical protein